MTRIEVGAVVGAVCGVVTLAGAGAWAGFTHPDEMVRPGLQPGFRAAALGAFLFAAYYWWLAALLGMAIGGLVGLVGIIGRPRPGHPT